MTLSYADTHSVPTYLTLHVESCHDEQARQATVDAVAACCMTHARARARARARTHVARAVVNTVLPDAVVVGVGDDSNACTRFPFVFP